MENSNLGNLMASLVPLESDDDWCAEMQGFALKNVTLSAYEDDRLIYRELGEMLFTHFGVSGPLVLSASAHMRRFGRCAYRLEIDLKPGLDEKKLDARILRDFDEYKNRDFKNALCDLAGRSMDTCPFFPSISWLSFLLFLWKKHPPRKNYQQKKL